MSDYDLDTLDAIIEENLWQAALDGLDDHAVADLILRHRDGVICDGLAGQVGFEREVATEGGLSRRRFSARRPPSQRSRPERPERWRLWLTTKATRRMT